MALTIFAGVLEPGKCKETGVRQFDGIGLLWRLPFFRPFQEKACRNETASFLEGLAPYESFGDRLRSGVDGR